MLHRTFPLLHAAAAAGGAWRILAATPSRCRGRRAITCIMRLHRLCGGSTSARAALLSCAAESAPAATSCTELRPCGCLQRTLHAECECAVLRLVLALTPLSRTRLAAKAHLASACCCASHTAAAIHAPGACAAAAAPARRQCTDAARSTQHAAHSAAAAAASCSGGRATKEGPREARRGRCCCVGATFVRRPAPAAPLRPSAAGDAATAGCVAPRTPTTTATAAVAATLADVPLTPLARTLASVRIPVPGPRLSRLRSPCSCSASPHRTLHLTKTRTSLCPRSRICSFCFCNTPHSALARLPLLALARPDRAAARWPLRPAPLLHHAPCVSQQRRCIADGHL